MKLEDIKTYQVKFIFYVHADSKEKAEEKALLLFRTKQQKPEMETSLYYH